MIPLPTNRALHPSDYQHGDISSHVECAQQFEWYLKTKEVPFSHNHEHRIWEYANVLRQVGMFKCGKLVLEAGAGASMLAPMLATFGCMVDVLDSMKFGNVRQAIKQQCEILGVRMPCFQESIEDMPQRDNTYDFVTCISVIEHVDPKQYERALRELCRVTKPGGYIFMTSDYFRDEVHAASPMFDIQLNCLTEDRIKEIPRLIPVKMVGGTDLIYRGDFVYNYSFVNICLQKALG